MLKFNDDMYDKQRGPVTRSMRKAVVHHKDEEDAVEEAAPVIKDAPVVAAVNHHDDAPLKALSRRIDELYVAMARHKDESRKTESELRAEISWLTSAVSKKTAAEPAEPKPVAKAKRIVTPIVA